MTSGGININVFFDHFPENQLTKFRASVWLAYRYDTSRAGSDGMIFYPSSEVPVPV